MSVTPFKRGKYWWARGRFEYNGRPIGDYFRTSTGSLTEAGARDWIKEQEDRALRGYLLGPDTTLTFGDAVVLYLAKPKEAVFLMRLIPDLGELPVASITGKMIRNLAAELYPDAATDTWWRQVVTPTRAVINNAHDLGKCSPIRVKAYTEQERIDQDTKRGKQSRVERKPSNRSWIASFCNHADPYNAALIQFMFETGARIDQAVSLVPNDLDLMNRRVWLKEAKGHPAQWVTISQEMVVQLANLPPKHPFDRKNNRKLEKRVFGYGNRGGPRKAWKTICKKAGIEYLTPHSAGRHGFYTELRVRQGVDPVTAAKMGRWKTVSLPDQIYAHVEADEGEIRDQIRTGHVHYDNTNPPNVMKKKGFY